MNTMLWKRICLAILLVNSAAAVAGQQTEPGASFDNQVVVRTVELIRISKSKEGDIFPATVDKPVQVDGRTVRFDRAEIMLVRVGRGSEDLSLRLHSLFADGRKYSVKSDLAVHFRRVVVRGRGIRSTQLILSKASGNLEIPKGKRLGFNLTQPVSLR